MRRGEVWWAILPGAAGRRPVVLLSRDEVYDRRSYVTMAPASTRIRGLATEVRLGPEDGLRAECAVNLDSIGTHAKSRLLRQIATLGPHKMLEVERAIHFALALST